MLGLAWLAELITLGGICEPWNTHYSMSFNTAVVTFLNHGKMIGDRTATLTIAHELGHGFGAQVGLQCSDTIMADLHHTMFA